MSVDTNHDLFLLGGSSGGCILIGDSRFDDGSGGEYTHVNAETGLAQAELRLAGPAEVDAAVAAARAALPDWREWKPDRRRDVLLNLARLVRAAAPELAELLIREVGMTARTAQNSSGNLAEWVTYYAGWVEKIHGEVIPVYPQEGLDYVLPEPYGVVAALIPWNGPLAPIGMKVVPALAAGNCVVLKPSELAPFSALRFAELCLAAGIPPGVVNVVPGGPLTGAALCGHPGVDKVSFTGGAATAQKVLAAAAVNLTPAVLELGGKSANLIFDDAELAAAVPFAASLSMLRTGQACLVPSRLLVAESIYDQVVERLVAVLSALKVGSPRDMATDIGPVISKDRCAAIETIIDDARTTGAGRLVTGGRRLGGALANGFFIEPTVFADVDTSSGLAQEEIFGPVLCVTPFIDETEAVALANSTRYGLSAYVWTNDLKRTHRLARQLVAGAVCINGFAVPVNAPFGGQRHSGFGREGGRYGLDEFLSPKNVFVGL